MDDHRSLFKGWMFDFLTLLMITLPDWKSGVVFRWVYLLHGSRFAVSKEEGTHIRGSKLSCNSRQELVELVGVWEDNYVGGR